VGGGANRQVSLPEQAVAGDHTVARREHVGQVGPHTAVHGACAPDTQCGPGAGGKNGVGADARDQDHVGYQGYRRAISRGGLHLEPCGFAAGPGDLADRGASQDLGGMLGELGVDELAERGI
jgi:hypothetical protein